MIKSPLISRTSRYRVLLRLEAVERFWSGKAGHHRKRRPLSSGLESDPLGRRVANSVIGFYHSHFPEAYVRTARKFCGETVTEFFMDFSRRYIRSLYGRLNGHSFLRPPWGRCFEAGA